MNDAATADRTLGHAVTEARFAIEYAELHEKLWSHLDTMASLVQIVAGAVALVGVALPKEWQWLTPAAAILLAAIAGFQVALKPRERSITFRDTRRELEELLTRAGDFSLGAFDRELDLIRSKAPRGIDALTTPAQNRALARYGYPTDRIGPWQTFLTWCAA